MTNTWFVDVTKNQYISIVSIPVVRPEESIRGSRWTGGTPEIRSISVYSGLYIYQVEEVA
jgi:hypothetical protein